MLSSVVAPIDNEEDSSKNATKYGISEEVIVVGVIDHFEIWDLAT